MTYETWLRALPSELGDPFADPLRVYRDHIPGEVFEALPPETIYAVVTGLDEVERMTTHEDAGLISQHLITRLYQKPALHEGRSVTPNDAVMYRLYWKLRYAADDVDEAGKHRQLVYLERLPDWTPPSADPDTLGLAAEAHHLLGFMIP